MHFVFALRALVFVSLLMGEVRAISRLRAEMCVCVYMYVCVFMCVSESAQRDIIWRRREASSSLDIWDPTTLSLTHSSSILASISNPRLTHLINQSIYLLNPLRTHRSIDRSIYLSIESATYPLINPSIHHKLALLSILLYTWSLSIDFIERLALRLILLCASLDQSIDWSKACFPINQ